MVDDRRCISQGVTEPQVWEVLPLRHTRRRRQEGFRTSPHVPGAQCSHLEKETLGNELLRVPVNPTHIILQGKLFTTCL